MAKRNKNTIPELKTTGEGIKSRLDETEDWISELEDEVEKTRRKSKKGNQGQKE